MKRNTWSNARSVVAHGRAVKYTEGRGGLVLMGPVMDTALHLPGRVSIFFDSHLQTSTLGYLRPKNKFQMFHFDFIGHIHKLLQISWNRNWSVIYRVWRMCDCDTLRLFSISSRTLRFISSRTLRFMKCGSVILSLGWDADRGAEATVSRCASPAWNCAASCWVTELQC